MHCLKNEHSGPKGLHTISPEEEHRTVNNEFIIAITEELFAPIILVGTFANNIFFDPYHYFGFNGSSFSFFDKTYFPINLTEFEPGSQLAFLHQTDEGLIHQLAPHEDGNLLINAENFNSISKGNTIHATTIIIVKDMPRWLELIKGKNEVTEIIDNVEVFGILPQIIEADSNQIDLDSLENTTEMTIAPTPSVPAIILDDLGVIRFISERSFIKDIKFYIRKCKPLTQDEFLDEFGFDEYIEEVYGTIYAPSMNNVFKEKLGLLSSWELNSDLINISDTP